MACVKIKSVSQPA